MDLVFGAAAGAGVPRRTAAFGVPQNVLTYTEAECKIVTERLSAYTEDPDSVF